MNDKFPPRLFIDPEEPWLGAHTVEAINTTEIEYLSLEEHQAILDDRENGYNWVTSQMDAYTCELEKSLSAAISALTYIARDTATDEIDCAHEQADTYVEMAKETLKRIKWIKK